MITSIKSGCIYVIDSFEFLFDLDVDQSMKPKIYLVCLRWHVAKADCIFQALKSFNTFRIKSKALHSDVFKCSISKTNGST